MATRTKAGRKKTSARKGTAKKGTAKKGRAATKKKTAARRPAAKKKTRTKRAPNPAFMKPMQPDQALSAVVGSQPQPRTEITKRLWAYIKRKGLQDQKERRMINADENLRPVFGGKSQVSMFEMTKHVNKHLKDT